MTQRIERPSPEREIMGSSPIDPPCNARVVQWLEHLSYTQEVDGSSPSTSTRLRAVFGLAVSRRSCVKWVFRRTSWRHVPHVILRVCI